MTETFDRIYAQWRTSTTIDADRPQVLTVAHECVLCGFRFIQHSRSGDLEDCNRHIREARARMRRHEQEHPAEATVREFFQFKEQLHNSLIPGLDALMQRQ